jgi:hypothetical protein
MSVVLITGAATGIGTSADSSSAAVQTGLEQAGQLDVVVHNAGHLVVGETTIIMPGAFTPALHWSPAPGVPHCHSYPRR